MQYVSLERGIVRGGPFALAKKPEEPRAVEVTVPTCIDLLTLDSSSRFSPNPGGGGVGLAIDERISMTIAPSDAWNVHNADAKAVEHLGRCIMSTIGRLGGFRVDVKGDRSAAQLLSAEELLTGFAAGVNASFGRPLNQHDLRRLVSYNLGITEGDGCRLVPNSGVRIAGALFGGFTVLTEGHEIICRATLPTEGTLFVVSPIVDPSPLDIERVLQMERKDKDKKASEVLLKLIPAAIRCDWAKVGDSVYRLQLLGSKVAEIRRFDGGEGIYRLLSMLRSKGCAIEGVHADTGTILAFSDLDHIDDCLRLVEELGFTSSLVTADAAGAKVTVKN